MYYFVITCAVGTVLQGAFYGMAFGWLSVAIAFVFVDSQLRSLRSYIDELSGLFGRKYMNYCLERIHATQEKDIYGIMMDVNCFKEINDTYGHGAGDRAIQEIGHILSGALVANSVAIRISGDEFMVLIRHGSEEILNKICAAIEQRVQRYNAAAPAGGFSCLSPPVWQSMRAAAWRNFWWNWTSGCMRKSAPSTPPGTAMPYQSRGTLHQFQNNV